MSRSIAARNAARVLPEPVGAKTSVDSPRRIAAQARAWARVGAGKLSANHSSTAGWKRPGTGALGSGGAIPPRSARGTPERPTIIGEEGAGRDRHLDRPGGR